MGHYDPVGPDTGENCDRFTPETVIGGEYRSYYTGHPRSPSPSRGGGEVLPVTTGVDGVPNRG